MAMDDKKMLDRLNKKYLKLFERVPGKDRIVRKVFGEEHTQSIFDNHRIVDSGEISKFDVGRPKDTLLYVVFDEVVLFMRKGSNKFECFYLNELIYSRINKGKLVLKWPHRKFTLECESSTLDRVQAGIRSWKENASRKQKAFDKAGLSLPVMCIGNCIVQPGTTSIGTRSPPSAFYGSTLDDLNNLMMARELQALLGVTCDWILAKRRSVLCAGCLELITPCNRLSRQVVLLSDCFLLLRKTKYKTTCAHRFDVVQKVPFNIVKVARSGTRIIIRTSSEKKIFHCDEALVADEWEEAFTKAVTLARQEDQKEATKSGEEMQEAGTTMTTAAEDGDDDDDDAYFKTPFLPEVYRMQSPPTGTYIILSEE